ncbi:FitA-like ribbon-helix-helix domain-containing protein [Spiribacter vilamensis]|uniref:Plasmid stability protein n=1 Tax=Spiribacter vilamensis TaxID=531306 RepID=A0A4Q8D1Q9_9GAMM|nr:plasmid stabilization protein [Spiribacter vilamensis]RZU99207.1 plasmid stability protein [Spiribacter vilamensis]TVO61805.1 plasmid stabilization protein [Spiribacter vilamensis]
MAAMTIRHLDEALKHRLRIQAAEHGRSMEDEARDILRVALSSDDAEAGSLYETIRRRVEPLGGVELDVPRREPMREPPDLSE